MTAVERGLATALEYVHPAAWRRTLRREAAELRADLTRTRGAVAGHVADERVAAEQAHQRHLEAVVAAAVVLTGSEQRFSPASTRRLLSQVPIGEDGLLDEAAFVAAAFEEAAAYAEQLCAARSAQNGS